MIKHEGGGVDVVERVGWLHVDPSWLAGLWNLKATGEVRLVGGAIQVGVASPAIERGGQVVVGMIATAFVPTAVLPHVAAPQRIDT